MAINWLNWNSSYYHHQIRCINHSNCSYIFLWMCAWGGCTIICPWFHLYNGKVWFSPFIIVQSYGVRPYWSAYWRDGHIRLFTHYTTSVSSLCRRIWKDWNYTMLVRYILSSVRVKLSQFFQLSFNHHIGPCVFSLPISLVIIVTIRVLHRVLQ